MMEPVGFLNGISAQTSDYFGVALAPLAVSVVISLLCYAAYRWLTPIAEELQQAGRRTSSELMGILAELEGVEELPGQERPKLRIHTKEVSPRRGQMMRLGLCHACALILPFLMTTAWQPLSTWQTPDLKAPASLQSPMVIVPTPHTHVAVWINADGGLHASLGNGDVVALEAGALADFMTKVQTDTDRSWLLYADAKVSYGQVEDVLEVMGSASMRKVLFMGTQAP